MFLATIFTCYATVAASTRLHKSALHALLRSPMSFFDVTPLGAIVNRVGKVNFVNHYCKHFLCIIVSIFCILSRFSVFKLP